MPVLIDRGSGGCRIFAGSNPPRTTPPGPSNLVGGEWIRIGLLNNMPDAAIEATEQQFLGLLHAASGHQWVHLRLFSLDGVPRTPRGRELTRHYFKSAELFDADLDGLIVTGTEPRANNLMDEPYWDAFARVVDWAGRNTISTLWSCLASHAAVLHLDRIVRTPLDQKCFGLFDCDVVADHPLTANLPAGLRIPHARFNDLQENALAAASYRVLTRSPEVGVDMFIRDRKSLFVFLQGHPEYDARSLLNEYRRDIGRFLRGERDTYPPMPSGYFDEPTAEALMAFRQRALSSRGESLFAEFPAAESELTASWFPAAAALYRNWLSIMLARKARTLMRDRDIAPLSLATS